MNFPSRLLAGICLIPASTFVLADSIEIVDTNLLADPDPFSIPFVSTSLELDSNGYPVVSYHDEISSDLKILHCNDANCAGGDESIETIESPSDIGGISSLELDSSGNPVVLYYNVTSNSLSILHCNDANCADGDESIERISTSPASRFYGHESLTLDGSGNPVVVFRGESNSIRVLHCNDANCSGGDESIETVDLDAYGFDLEDVNGRSTSLVLDSDGNPVVSFGSTFDTLGVLHCNDANCSGGDESVEVLDGLGAEEFVGDFTSLRLDSDGNPVVSYSDDAGITIKVLHCNDANCAGSNESIVSVDGTGGGQFISLALDADGNPVVSYFETVLGDDLRILHCNDVNCSGADESIQGPDTGGVVGVFTSLMLDSGGNPVVSYYDFTNGDLKILHCNDPNCAPELIIDIDIKPGGSRNSVNPSSKQSIPVAVLTSEFFDASLVNWETVLFGPDGASAYHERSHLEDVDEDGDMDALFHFKVRETGILCGATEATLTGETFSGVAFIGTDSISTVPCK